jgi:hypothetical protein
MPLSKKKNNHRPIFNKNHKLVSKNSSEYNSVIKLTTKLQK